MAMPPCHPGFWDSAELEAVAEEMGVTAAGQRFFSSRSLLCVWHFFLGWMGWPSFSSCCPRPRTQLRPGVKREGEGGTNVEGEVDFQALAGQRLAEVQALEGQRGVSFIHCSHFGVLLN